MEFSANAVVSEIENWLDLCCMYIEHLAIWVHNLQRMKAFYETYFNATANEKYVNADKGFSSYFLTFPDGGSRLEIMQMDSIPETKNNALTQFLGLIHFAISVDNESAVDDLTNRLRTDGFIIVGEPRRTGDGYYESVVFDPEENRIEITA